MRVLIVKTSSMGDVIHTLPALTDAGNYFPDITFDWVVEENFSEIPAWHPRVSTIIPVAIRRWRKKIFSAETRKEFRHFCHLLREKKYDLVIDAQALWKSALITCLARGLRSGPDKNSARDPMAALFYQKKFFVNRQQHAVTRMRQLFSQALGYSLPNTIPDYGVDRKIFSSIAQQKKYVVFLHGTTWPTKHWPEGYWIALAELVNKAGLSIKLPWGNSIEHVRAQKIAAACTSAEVLPKLALKEIAAVLANATAIVAVDTGLGHLAAALDVPTVSIYGSTNPALTGALGQSQIHLAAQFSCAPCLNRVCTQIDYISAKVSDPPCYATVSPAQVWSTLTALIKAHPVETLC